MVTSRSRKRKLLPKHQLMVDVAVLAPSEDHVALRQDAEETNSRSISILFIHFFTFHYFSLLFSCMFDVQTLMETLMEALLWRVLLDPFQSLSCV